MTGARVVRLILAVVVALPVLRATPAYSWHGSSNITALVIDPQRPTTLYAGTSDRGVFKTTDGGVTWSATGLTNIYVAALVIDPVTPTTLYAVGWGGLYKSTDGGTNWSLINDLTGVGVSSLAIDPQTSTTLYGWTYDRVFKSTDGGASWSATGLTTGPCDYPYPCGGVLALAIDPLTPTTLYVGTDALTFLYTDGFWYTSGDVYKSTDGGVTWGSLGLAWEVQPHVFSALAIDPLIPTTLYAGTNVGPNGAFSCDEFKSTDGGASWSFTGLTGRCVSLLAIDPLTPTTLYAGSYYLSNYETMKGLFKSTDGGASWNVTGLTGIPYGAGDLRLAIDPLTPTTLFAGVGTSGVLKSTDGGLTWNATGLETALSSVSLNPTSVTAGSTSTGTVTLSTATPTGDAVVKLFSSNPSVAAVPASVTVPTGATSASFAVSTFACTSGSVSISGSYAGLTRSAGLTVTATPDTVVIQTAEYFARRQVLRVEATSTGSTARLWVYDTSTSSGTFIGELTHYDGDKYRGQFAWKFASQVNPQITVQSNLCGWAKKDVTLK